MLGGFHEILCQQSAMESEFAAHGELCSRYHVYKNLWGAIVGEELPWEWYAVAVMRRSTIVGHEPRKILLLARYFWPISCLLAISGRSETEVL